jgi:hypothetical protein
MRDDGCALLDAYFPQLNIGIEVDEAQHKINDNIKADRCREKDVIRAIGCDIYHIDVTHSILDIHRRCDEIIKLIKDRMNSTDFEIWDTDNEYAPDRFIQKGCMSTNDNPAFRKHIDALKCFGIYYKASWTGGEPHPVHDDVLIWFPKIHARKEWINVIDDEETTIYEKNEDPKKTEETISIWLSEPRQKRYVFVYSKDSLGMVLYRFKGVFELDKQATISESCAVWRKVCDVVETTDQILKGTK